MSNLKINSCEIKNEDRAYWGMFTDNELKEMIKKGDRNRIRKALLDRQLQKI